MKITRLLTAAAVFALVACGGGGGGGTNTNGTVHFTHSQLANEFVRRLNLDLGYDVDLVKVNTRQYDYIVVYDYDLNSYDAYWIGNYEVGESLTSYLNYYDYKFYYDLDFVGYIGSEEIYEDFWTGLQFNEGNAKTRSVRAMQEHLANVFKAAKATAIMDQYGLERERANDLVTMSMNFKALSRKGALTVEEYDDFALDAVGSTASDIIKMNENNDVIGGIRALNRAADANKIGIEHMSILAAEEFGLSFK